MKPLPRGRLTLCIAASLLLAAVQPASAQRQRGSRPGMNIGNPPAGNDIGQPGGINFGTPPNNAAAAAVASSVSTGMMVAGIGLILAGLALTGGVVYLALQGQKTSYGGGSRRRKRPRRDDGD